jgi:hypothetical protein
MLHTPFLSLLLARAVSLPMPQHRTRAQDLLITAVHTRFLILATSCLVFWGLCVTKLQAKLVTDYIIHIVSMAVI